MRWKGEEGCVDSDKLSVGKEIFTREKNCDQPLTNQNRIRILMQGHYRVFSLYLGW
jgi:hypothetical protein